MPKKPLKYKYQSLEDISPSFYNIHVMKVGHVFYFGFEDRDSSNIRMSNKAIVEMILYIMGKHKPSIDNAFFFAWWTNYPNRGIEQIEFPENDDFSLRLDKPFRSKKYCDIRDNPIENNV